eukprot:scaffold230214_cov19-Tisochrysis_lutea.AAC.1
MVQAAWQLLGSGGNGAVRQWCKCSAATVGQLGQWGSGGKQKWCRGVLLQLWWPSGGRCSNACRGKAAPAVVQTGQCCRCGDLGAAGAAAQWGRGEE